MEREIITSRSNPSIKRARALIRRRALRYRERAFFAEGVRVLDALLAANIPIEVLFIDAKRLDDIDSNLLERLQEHADRTLLVSTPTFKEMADTEHPQPLAAICTMPAPSEAALDGVVLALDAIRDPGNMGTLTRLAAAFGAQAIALLPGCVDPFSPKCVRASSGAIARIPFIRVHALGEISARSTSPPFIVAADSGGPVSLAEVAWRWPAVITIGSEADGLSDSSRESAENLVSIPIAVGIESLNAASAGAILLWEAFQARNRDPIG